MAASSEQLILHSQLDCTSQCTATQMQAEGVEEFLLLVAGSWANSQDLVSLLLNMGLEGSAELVKSASAYGVNSCQEP